MRPSGTGSHASLQRNAGHIFARIAAFERKLLLGVGAAALLFLAGCGDSDETEPAATETAPAEAEAPAEVLATEPAEAYASLPRLEGEATVVVTVNGSPITIKVDGEKAPITGGNFVDLVKKEVYNGTVFHRVVREPEPFVVQGGDPQSKDPNVPVEAFGTGSYMDESGESRYIPLEILPEGEDKPLYSTTFSSAQLTKPPALTHKRGAVAMARSQFPDSASAQFYFTLGDVNFLDGEYAVFGEVLEGMDVVDQIQQGDIIESVVIVDGADNLKGDS